MKKNLDKSLLAGIGLLSMTREKAQKIVNDLNKQGELEKAQAEKRIDQIINRGKEEHQVFRKIIREEVKDALDELGVVAKGDIEQSDAKESPREQEKPA